MTKISKMIFPLLIAFNLLAGQYPEVPFNPDIEENAPYTVTAKHIVFINHAEGKTDGTARRSYLGTRATIEAGKKHGLYTLGIVNPNLYREQAFIDLHYFDKEELRTLAFELRVDYDNLPEAKDAFARELIVTSTSFKCKRHSVSQLSSV